MDAARELRSALKRLSRAPLFVALYIAIEAFGIGLTASVGTLYHALFQAHQIRDISEVVDIQRMRPPFNALSTAEVEFIAAHQNVFSDLLPWAVELENLAAHGRQPEWIRVETVGANYFAFVGQAVSMGRAFLPEDDRRGSPLVTIISDAVWRKIFNADAHVVGRTITLGEHTLEIVGVAPSSFRGIDRPNASSTKMWVPLATAQVLTPRSKDVDEQLGLLYLEGRLKPGVSVAQARAQLAMLAGQMDQERPPQTGGIHEPYAVRRTFRVRAADTVRIGDQEDVIGLPLGTLAMVTTLAVFLIVCVNLAILSIARAYSRRHETAIRITVGASPARLIVAHALESALVSIGGMLGGMAIGRVLLDRMVVAARGWPGFREFAIPEANWFSGLVAATALACFLIVACSPASTFKRRRVAAVLSMKASVGGSTNRSLQRALIVAQIALSFVLVSIAAVCSRQVAVAAAHNPGIDLDRLAIVQPDFWIRAFGPSPPDPGRVRETCEEILAYVRRLRGVETAALSSGLPFGKAANALGWITVPDRPFRPGFFPGGYPSVLLVSTPEVFRTLGVHLLHGRLFDWRDTEGTEPVIVITQMTASKVFAGRNPVGQRVVLLRQQRPGDPTARTQEMTVIAVVSDIDAFAVGRRSEGVVFVPFAQSYHPTMAVVARAANPQDVVEAMRTAVWKVDPQVSVLVSGTGPVVGGTENLLLRGTARVSVLLGFAALLFSMGGLGSVLWTMVVSRGHEIAVRMALGATPGVIARTVVRDGLKPVCIGIIAGALLSGVASMTLRPAFLEFVPAVNPFVLAVVSLLMVLVALATSYVPARQAAGNSPQTALKEV